MFEILSYYWCNFHFSFILFKSIEEQKKIWENFSQLSPPSKESTCFIKGARENAATRFRLSITDL